MTAPSDSAAGGPLPPGAIFNGEPVCAVDSALIETLKAEALRSPLGRYRICMHHSTDDPMQSMVVAHRRGNYSRPHYHPNAAMSYTVIEGRMDVLVFDDTGEVTRRINMGCHGDTAASTPSLYLAAGIFYTPVCLTETVVFYESLGAPNPEGRETLYTDWSPGEDEQERVVAYCARHDMPYTHQRETSA